jgi:hypothetical protein
MPLGIDRRLTVAGLLVGVAVALIGVGVTILWPEAKGLGWCLLFLGSAILFLWLVFEIKQWMGDTVPSMVIAILVGCVIGGSLGFLFWKTNAGVHTATVGDGATGTKKSGLQSASSSDHLVDSVPAASKPEKDQESLSHSESHTASKKLASVPIHRPYLYKGKIELAEDEQIVRVKFKNESDLPALEVTTQIQWVVFDAVQAITHFIPEFGDPGSSGNVAPRQEIACSARTGKADFPDSFTAAKEGKMAAYVFGQITYKDLDGRRYQPRFCAHWIPSGGAAYFEECAPNDFTKGQIP